MKKNSPKLSARLFALTNPTSGQSTLTLSTLIAETEGKAYNLLLILLSLPFLTPVPIPMLSTVFGIFVVLFGIQIIIGVTWIPKSLREKKIASKTLHAVLVAAEWVLKILEKFLRPRLSNLAENRVWLVIEGFLISICGALLLLPLPIPFTNFFPAATILLLAAGSLEKDGLAIIAGFGMFVLTIAYFVFLAFGGVAAIKYLNDWLFHSVVAR